MQIDENALIVYINTAFNAVDNSKIGPFIKPNKITGVEEMQSLPYNAFSIVLSSILPKEIGWDGLKEIAKIERELKEEEHNAKIRP
jgi:hypothetical protein